MILISYLYFPPYTTPFLAKGYEESTLQGDIGARTVKLPPNTEYRLWQPITATKEGLNWVLWQQFSVYGIVSQLGKAQKTISCESGFQVDPTHNNISWGVAQFTKDTWLDYGYGNIMNPYSQLEVMAKMWKLGLQHRWNCYK